MEAKTVKPGPRLQKLLDNGQAKLEQNDYFDEGASYIGRFESGPVLLGFEGEEDNIERFLEGSWKWLTPIKI